MTTSGKSFENADGNSHEQASNEQIRRSHENQAGFPHATQVDQRDEHQNSEAQCKRMRLQARHRGNKRADTSGNAHCNHQNVINHESSGGKEASGDAEILARDGVRPTTRGIGLYRLTVGKIDDDQQYDDVALIGTIYAMPAAPRGMSSVKAASGP